MMESTDFLPPPPARLGLTIAALSLALAAAPAAAQSGMSFAPHLGVETGVPGTPVLGGLGLTWYDPVPWLALRGRIDIGITTADLEEEAGEPMSYRMVAGDLDVILTPRSDSREDAWFGPVDPAVFVGLGIRTARDSAYDGTLSPILSYGAGVRYWWTRLIRLEVEARYRTTLTGADDLAADFGDGLSVSVGAAFQFGESRGARSGQGSGSQRPTPTRAGNEMAVGVLTPDQREPERPPLARLDRLPDLDRRVRRSWGSPEEETVGGALQAAERFLGVPYVWGGATPEPGFDCSGFVQYIYEQEGIPLPRPSRRMALAGAELPPEIDALRPGDLMFFAEDGDRISHVAIYVGDNQILHSSSSGEGVGYDDLTTRRGRWYTQHFVSGSRVVGVPIRALRSRPVPLTLEEWDPVADGAPPPDPSGGQ